MRLAVAGGFAYVEHRRLIDLFPDDWKKVWIEWELRVLILFSLALQVVLVVLGNRRKYTPRIWIRVLLWSAYLMAEWVATVSLGVISKNIQDDCECPKYNGAPNDELTSFWAPFLLLHLGGPDTITAYSLEDNELWLRHLLGLLVQSGVALYIFLMAWPGAISLSILSIFILVAGLIKYAERTLALRMANSGQLRSSMLTKPDPGPNYAKFMEEFSLRKAEGFHVEADEVIEPSVPTNRSNEGDDANLILKAFDLFNIFRRLFVDLILSFQDREYSQSYFHSLKSAEKAFQVVEIELGFAFDVIYTKRAVVCTRAGCIMRFISSLFTISVLVGFASIPGRKNKYHKIDLVITYLLLAVAVLLEIYGAILLLSSDWTEHWLSQNRTRKFALSLRSPRSKKQWWSNSMAQYNLLRFSLQDMPNFCCGIDKLLGIDEMLEQHRHKTYTKVSKELKELIFNRFLKASENSTDLTGLCNNSGGLVIRKREDNSLEWCSKLEFDQSILIWHVATDICYYSHGDDHRDWKCRESKHVSDYMLYLLVMCPFTLPIGIGMIRFRDTVAEAKEFFKDRELQTEKSRSRDKSSMVKEACKMLLEVNTEVLPVKVKGDRSKSVLFDACRLAWRLLEMKSEERWEKLSEAWVNILAHAAAHCRGNHHAQQLRKGGELLTHVWLLMAHLGITQHFQISQGHARAKLRLK